MFETRSYENRCAALEKLSNTLTWLRGRDSRRWSHSWSHLNTLGLAAHSVTFHYTLKVRGSTY